MLRVGFVISSLKDYSRLESWMNGTSGTSNRTNFEALCNATSLLASGAGHMHFDWPRGTTLDLFGPDHAPASPSAAPEPGKASQTQGTCGQHGATLSPSDALQSSLESNLRALLNGSDWCVVTWKPWTTPWGQCLSKPRASEHNSSGTAIGLLPALTTRHNLLSPSMQKWPLHRRLMPALTARDWKSSSPGTQGNSRPLSEHIPGPINPMWAASHMGYPAEFIRCAPLATRSSRKSRRPSSKPVAEALPSNEQETKVNR
jgi:hypothetical protein